jgi:hypothetical protein
MALLFENLPPNKKHAVIVRLAEKQILRGTIEKQQAIQRALRGNGDQDKSSLRKRKSGAVGEEMIEGSKKVRR